MKTLWTIPAILLIFSLDAASQEVKMKKGKVTFDGMEVMDYTYDMMLLENHVYNLGTKDEILLITYKNNGTKDYKDDDYCMVYITPLNIKIRSRSLFFGLKGEAIFKKMVLEGVVRGDGAIDEVKANIFADKYHEE